MAVTMMPVLAVLLIIRAARSVVVRVTAFVMVMIMRMKARRGHLFPRVTMQASRRGPGKLERNDEHDDQGEEATHGSDSTDFWLAFRRSVTNSVFPVPQDCF